MFYRLKIASGDEYHRKIQEYHLPQTVMENTPQKTKQKIPQAKLKALKFL